MLYKVYKYKDYPDKSIFCISKEINEIKSNDKIDYAIYKYNNDNGYELGDSNELKIGDTVKLIGFPNFSKDDSPNIQNCYITSKTKFFGTDLFSVS